MQIQKINQILTEWLVNRYRARLVTPKGDLAYYILPNGNYIRLDSDNGRRGERIVAIYGRKGGRWGVKYNFMQWADQLTGDMILEYLDVMAK